MPTPIYLGESGGSRIYKVGRTGLDTGTADTGGAYTGTLKTEKISPAGEDGLCYFRRVAIRCWHTGGYTMTVTVYVDGAQTQVYSATTGVKETQSVTFVVAAPTSSPAETISEIDLTEAHGTFIEVQVVAVSTNVTGVWLPESVEVHYLPLRQAKSRGGAETA